MLPYLRHLYIATLFCAMPGMLRASWPSAALKKTWVTILPTAKFSRKQKVCFGSLAALGVGTLSAWCCRKYLSSNDYAAMRDKVQLLQAQLDKSFESDPKKMTKNNAYVVLCEQISVMRDEEGQELLKCVACVSAKGLQKSDATLLQESTDNEINSCIMYEFSKNYSSSSWFKNCQDKMKKVLANDLQGNNEKAINERVQVLGNSGKANVKDILEIAKTTDMWRAFLPRAELSETDPYEIVIKLVPDPNAPQGIEMLRINFKHHLG